MRSSTESLPFDIRLATLNDAALLPDIERSAGALFRAIPDLAWIADDGVMAVEAHERLIAAGACWVAVLTGEGSKFSDKTAPPTAHGEEGLSLSMARLEPRTSFETRLRPSTSSGLQPLLRMSGEKVIAAFLSAEYFAQDLHIWEISVHASAQGRGIGRRLIEAAVTHAREVGLEAVTLTTFRDVGWNAPYYARLGFETQSDDALSPRLRAVLDAEIANGLPGERRCAMRLSLD